MPLLLLTDAYDTRYLQTVFPDSYHTTYPNAQNPEPAPGILKSYTYVSEGKRGLFVNFEESRSKGLFRSSNSPRR